MITFSVASATESALREEFSSVVSHCISSFLYILDGQNGQYSDFFFFFKFLLIFPDGCLNYFIYEQNGPYHLQLSQLPF